MLRKSVSAVLSLLVIAGLAAAQAKKDDPKKDAKNEIKATVVKVDAAKKTLTVKTEAGKTETLTIGDDTKFIGPKGGVSADKLKDDRLTPGAEVKIIMGKGKDVAEVHLPVRKKAPEKGK